MSGGLGLGLGLGLEPRRRGGAVETPLTILSNVAGWWDAQDAGSITLATGVSAWADKSGNGFDFTQATGANQPAYSADAGDGLPALTFAPSGRLNAGDLNINLGTVLIVLHTTAAFGAASSAQTPIHFGPGEVSLGASTSLLTNEIITINTANSGRNAWAHASEQLAIGRHVLATRWTGSKYEVRLNGVVIDNVTAGTPTIIDITALVLGLVPGFGNQYLHGIGEVVVSSGTDLAELQTLEAYAMARWGL